MSTITLDLKYAQEIIDFWSQKYDDAKTQLEAAQESLKAQDEATSKVKEMEDNLAQETEKRIAAEEQVKAAATQAGTDKDFLRDKISGLETEVKDLLIRLGKADSERNALTHQVTQLYSQASVLAAEADQGRKKRLTEMFPPVSFVDSSFTSQTIRFADSTSFLASLPDTVKATERLYFLPRPPSCMPLRVPSCGQPGYWFYPLWLPGPEGTEFELIVEGQPNQWTYLGRYSTAPLAGQDMRLSEWMILDEQTKLVHSTRVANQNLGAGQKASYASELDVKRRYELGEWSVPCYLLRCVGFSMPLYEAMHAVASSRGTPGTPRPMMSPIMSPALSRIMSPVMSIPPSPAKSISSMLDTASCPP